MSFEKFLDEDIVAEDFGKARYSKASKERQNVSKLRLDSDSGCEYLLEGGFYHTTYDDMRSRYCACINLVYDVMLVLFDYNTKESLVYRFTDFGSQLEFPIVAGRALNRGGEARLIGLQNGQQFQQVEQTYALIRKKGMAVSEIDLFGNETRHVAVDLKTGTTFDVLVENRPYKPGELVNRLTPEQFERLMKAGAQQPKSEGQKQNKPGEKFTITKALNTEKA